MDSLTLRLQRHYGQHYARMNDRQGLLPKQQRALDRTYRGLLEGLPEGSRVADLGCGTGHMLSWLKGYRQLQLVGVDSSPDQLSSARQLCPEVDFVCQDGAAFLEGARGHLAGIFCFDVLEHLPDPELAAWMDSVLAALQPGGFFCCRCPNAANILSGYSRYLDLTHVRSFTRTSLLQLLESSGFVDCRVLPQRGGWWGARLRLGVEYGAHQLIYHACGRRPETIVTGNVAVVGHRRA
jgi:SAM-dependent methyltransferase